MRLSSISKPKTSKTLNESLRKRWDQEMNLKGLSLERARKNLQIVESHLVKFKNSIGYGAEQEPEYMKRLMVAETLRAYIEEQSEKAGKLRKNGFANSPEPKKVSESKGKKPDYADIDGDGDKKEPMSKAAKDKKKKTNESIKVGDTIKYKKNGKGQTKSGKVSKIKGGYYYVNNGATAVDDQDVIKENKKSIRESKLNRIRKIYEAETDEAEAILAAQDMIDTITGMLEDLGEIQNEQLLPLVDKIRDVKGDDTATQFKQSVESALQQALDSMRTTREGMTQAKGILTGEQAPSMGADVSSDTGGDDLGGDMDLDMEPDLDDEPDLDVDDEADDFAASPAAGGDEETMGREKR